MSLQEPPFRLKANNFDYTALDSKIQILVRQRTSEIKERLRDAAQAIWDIGQKLVDIRDCLSYGQFNSWLKTEFQWSRSTAYNYINVFETFGSCPNFGQLNIAASALYLLAASSTPKEARKEALESARKGENITYMKAKTIISQCKRLSQRKKDQQSSTISVSAQPAEIKSFTTAEPSPATIFEPIPSAETVDTMKDAVVGKLVEQQLGEVMPQLIVDDFEVGNRVCILHNQNGEDKWVGKTTKESQKLSPVKSQNLNWFSIEKETESQLPPSVLFPEVFESVEQKLPQKLKGLNFTRGSSESLPNILQNHANPIDFDECSKVNPLPPISVNTDDICILLQANVKYLTDEQIKGVWQAIAHRMYSQALTLHKLSNSELEHLLKEAERELNQRQCH